FQRLRGITARHELQTAIHGSRIIDRTSIGRPLNEEHALVARDRVRQLPIGESRIRQAGVIQTRYVMPVACEAITAQPLLEAEDVDSRRLLP
ncbi:hypothetical protein LXF07_24425, partial [Escherichia coli]|nr:hypothetical protein [Escherichia coli]